MISTEEKLATSATLIDDEKVKRYKAVRSVKNRLKTHLESRQRQLTLTSARTKDATKLRINEAKLAEIDRALKLVAAV